MTQLPSVSLFIDGRKLGDGGIGTSISNLISGLLELYQATTSLLRLVILVPDEYAEKHRERVAAWKDSGCCIIPENCPRYSLRELFLLPLIHKQKIAACDWYVSPHYVLPFFIPVKKAVFIHDVIHLQFPEKLRTKVIADFLIRSAIRRSNLLITVSENSRKRITETFPDLALENIAVVPNATTLASTAGGKEACKEKTVKLLWVGADRKHKRFSFFISVLKKLRQESVLFQATVVSALQADSENLIRENDLVGQVVCLSDISEVDLESLYRNADIFVATSIEEGFCIPLLDAMRCRVPVLCPDLPFSKELADAHGWFYSPESVEDAVLKLKQVAESSDLRKQKCEGAFQKSLMYTPSRIAETFLSSLTYVQT
jgi:glycosyltransferase involved in cell wall biosynthesis